MRKYRQRIHYTEADKNMMWDRWRKGDSLESIAQLFDRTHGSVARILRRTGEIRPPKRTRSRQTLSLAEREEISRGVVASRSLRSIAASLNRAPSTVCPDWVVVSIYEPSQWSTISCSASSCFTSGPTSCTSP